MKNENLKTNKFDLEDRTLQFARDVRDFAKEFLKVPLAIDDIRQLIRSSGSVGANYIEANDGLSKKDFLMRIKICKKESKESRYWLRLIESPTKKAAQVQQRLENEASELMYIFATILRNSQ